MFETVPFVCDLCPTFITNVPTVILHRKSKISDAHDLNFRAKLKIKQRFRPLEVSKVC